MPVFNKSVSWEDSGALFPLEDWTLHAGFGNIHPVNAYKNKKCQLIHWASLTSGYCDCVYRFLKPIPVHVSSASTRVGTTAAAGFKQMCNSGRNVNSGFLSRVTVALCHRVRPAQQMEHQPVPRKKTKKKVTVPTHVYGLIPAANTGNTWWNLKFNSWAQKWWRASCAAPPQPFPVL